MEMFEFYLDKPIPATKSKKQKVLWMLEIARASNRKIKSMTFVYDYKIPRINRRRSTKISSRYNNS